MIKPNSTKITMKLHHDQFLEWLKAGNTGTKKEIAKHFSVSIKTIERAITTFKDAKVPIIEKTVNRKSVYAMAPQYLSQPVGQLQFTDAELHALLVTSEAVLHPFGSLPFTKDLQTAFTKLLENSEYFLFDPNDERKHWYFEDVAKNIIQQDIFMSIVETLWKGTNLWIRYEKPDGELSERKVNPHGLAFTKGNWQLVAHCQTRKEIRHFKVLRILALKCLDEPNLIAPIDLELELRYGSYKAEQDEIQIRVSAKAAKFFKEDNYHPTQQILAENPDGSLLVSYESWSFKDAIPMLFGWRHLIKVLSPPTLVQRMKEDIEALHGLYQ